MDESLNSCLTTQINGPDFCQFTPDRAIDAWLEKGAGVLGMLRDIPFGRDS